MKVSGPEKLIYLLLGAVCLVLGIIGLVIPIIPGILFLGGALYLLTRGSTRIRAFANTDPRLQSLQRRLERIDGVGFLDRIKVSGLMAADAVVMGIQKLTLGIRRLLA